MNNIIEDVYWEMDWSHKKPDGSRLYPHKPEKEMIFEEENALAMLLNNGIVFLNSHWWRDDWPDDAKKVASLNCNCNDVFAWGGGGARMPQRPVRQSIEKSGIWDLSTMELADNPS